MALAPRGWRRTWVFLAAGFAAALALSFIPGLPLAPGRWPLEGAFGAFTWTAWFVSSSLAFTLVFLAISVRLREPRSGTVRPGRVLLAASAFGLLAVGAFAAAAWADRIEQHPLATLVLAIAALVALRLIYARLLGTAR
jgi:hypothetical protein